MDRSEWMPISPCNSQCSNISIHGNKHYPCDKDTCRRYAKYESNIVIQKKLLKYLINGINNRGGVPFYQDDFKSMLKELEGANDKCVEN